MASGVCATDCDTARKAEPEPHGWPIIDDGQLVDKQRAGTPHHRSGVPALPLVTPYKFTNWPAVTCVHQESRQRNLDACLLASLANGIDKIFLGTTQSHRVFRVVNSGDQC